MKVLVTGYSGQLGFDVVQQGNKRGLSMIGISSTELDITDEKAVFAYVKELKPDVIIHCAAYTAVDKAEDDRDTCWDVNVNGTKYLASVAKSIDSKFVYISTDYVYDGVGDLPFSESDDTNPVGYYGYSKREGEKVVQQLINSSYIVRISWVFGINGSNFVKTMLRLSETHTELNVVGDQVGSPTYTYDLASLLLDMVNTEKYGVYHATNEGYCTWSDFATEIFRQTGKNVKVNSIPTEAYPTRAVRPKNSRLYKQKLIENGFQPLPNWKDALTHYLIELKFLQEVK